MDKKKRQSEEEEYEKKKALQREKVQAKKLFTSYFYCVSAGHCVTRMHLQNFIWSSGLCLYSVLFYDSFVIQTL